MKRVLTLISCFIIALSLLACQPTPKNVTVVQKDSDRMIQDAQKTTAKSESKNLSEQYGIPETYKYDKQGADGKLKIHADAQIIVPEENAMPIYRVKKAELSQETVSAFFKALCGDTEMYDYSEKRTKKQIQEQILYVKKYMGSGNKSDSEMKGLKRSLDLLEKELETAPEVLTEDRSYGKMTEKTDAPPPDVSSSVEEGTDTEPTQAPSRKVTSYIGVSAYERYEKGTNGWGKRFQADNKDSATMFYENFHNPSGGINFGSSGSVPVTGDSDIDQGIISKVGIKPSEAKKMVQDLLDKTGSNMKVDSVYLQNDAQKGNYDGEVRDAERYAYKIYCVRTVDGNPCSYVVGGSKPDTKDMMSPFWVYENMHFMVNSQGIFEMEWHSPIEIKETVNTDAQLKSFSEIKEIFEKMMSVKYEFQASQYNGMDFEINRVTLSLHRVIEKDSNDSGLLVPAWNFYGKLIVGSGKEQFEKTGETFMTISAIDGSVIDVNKGY